jgi:hypothetical protein
VFDIGCSALVVELRKLAAFRTDPKAASLRGSSMVRPRFQCPTANTEFPTEEGQTLALQEGCYQPNASHLHS